MTERERYLSEMAENEMRHAINAISRAQRLLPDESPSRETLSKVWAAAVNAEDGIRQERRP